MKPQPAVPGDLLRIFLAHSDREFVALASLAVAARRLRQQPELNLAPGRDQWPSMGPGGHVRRQPQGGPGNMGLGVSFLQGGSRLPPTTIRYRQHRTTLRSPQGFSIRRHQHSAGATSAARFGVGIPQVDIRIRHLTHQLDATRRRTSTCCIPVLRLAINIRRTTRTERTRYRFYIPGGVGWVHSTSH
jgi:hypothetical protein